MLESVHAATVTIETAELLATELVTNVVVHVGSPSELRIDSRPAVVRVEVRDHGAGVPAVDTPTVDGVRGRGLVIVDGMADAWGVDPIPDDGKTVWFELRTRDKAAGNLA